VNVIDDPDDTVIAPGGPRRRDATTHVPPAHAVERRDDGTYVVVPTGPAATDVNRRDTPMPQDLVLTPGGYKRAELVHHAPAGSVVDSGEGRLRHLAQDGTLLDDYGILLQRASGRPLHPLNVNRGALAAAGGPAPAFGTGWITYASWTNGTGTPVSRFSTVWTVPPEPATSNGQTIFLFNGIQNSTMIYQPVLQWGPSAAGGGAYWAVASWYADGQSGHSFYSTLVPVNVGDVLTGVMTETGSAAGQFSYNCEFTGVANTSLPATNIEELTWCIETLEAYAITAATDYPNTFKTPMSAIEIMTGQSHPAITWTATDAVTDTGQHTVVVSDVNPDGDVDICYRASGLVSPTVPGHAQITPVSRSGDHLDVFVTDVTGAILTAAWEPDFADWWHGWWPLNGGRAAPGAPVHAVSRSSDKLDAFVIGTDSQVYTAAWEPDFTDWWHGWWRLNNGVAASGAHVTAVSRSADKLDVFVVGTDGGVYTAAWEPGFTDWWHGWWRIGNVVAPQGAYVGAVSRSADKLDIFVTDLSGAIQTAAWEPDFSDGWHGWWPLNGGRAAPGAPVTAVSRSTDKLDVFVTGTDGGVYTAAWEPDFTDWWHGWWRIGGLVAPQGAYVGAVSRSADKLDILATDANGAIQTAAWEPAFTDGWHGWWALNGGRAAPGAPVTAVSRSADKLDAFVVGTDSRIYTAAWEPDFTDWWHGWWRMG
jgi:hypothetical protein